MKRINNCLVLCYCCLLLSACGAKTGKWIIWGYDVKMEVGLRADPVESLSRCIQQDRIISKTEFEKLFAQQVAIVERNRMEADWGSLACLAFHELATEPQVRMVLSLLPDGEVSSKEAVMLDLLRVLLDRRITTLNHLTKVEEDLDSNRELLEKLQKQIEKLEAIESLLERQ